MPLIFAIFSTASLLWFASLSLVLIRHGEPVYITQVNVLLGAFGVAVLSLIVQGLLLIGKRRWMALMLVAILLILFSGLSAASMGLFLAPHLQGTAE